MDRYESMKARLAKAPKVAKATSGRPKKQRKKYNVQYNKKRALQGKSVEKLKSSRQRHQEKFQSMTEDELMEKLNKK